jgi:hypothetical protein
MLAQVRGVNIACSHPAARDIVGQSMFRSFGSEHTLAPFHLAHVLVGEPASTSPEHALDHNRPGDCT